MRRIIAAGAVILFIFAASWLILYLQLRPRPSSSLTANTSQPTPTPRLSASEALSRAKSLLESEPTSDNMFTAVTLLKEIPAGAKEYKEAQGLLSKAPEIYKRAEEARGKRRAPELRAKLQESYRSTIAAANPHLNFIKAKITKAKGGYALWATHEYFSQYSLSIGGDAHVIQTWIGKNRSELNEAGIVRVGLMGSESYAGSSYFDLK